MRNLLFPLIIFAIIVPITPAFSQTLSWDQPFYRIGEIGEIELESIDANKNPSIKDLAKVWVYSDSDPQGIQLVVLETGSNSSIFKNEIEFGNVTNEFTINVKSGDFVFAEYGIVGANAKIEGMVPDFSVKVDSPSYQKGDTVKIEGTISNKEYDPNLLVVVSILNPQGNVIFSSQKAPANLGTYAVFTTIGGPSWERVGEYTVVSQYGSLKAETTFSYSGEEGSELSQPFEEHKVPWGLVANPISSSEIQLSWNPPTQTFGLEIVGYNINEKIGSGMFKPVTTIGDTPAYLVSGLERGETYTFVVQARYSVTVSEISDEVSATTLTTISSDEEPEIPLQSTDAIPDWVRNNAKWWAADAIKDSDFVSGIQYLIQERIIQIPETEESSSPTDSQTIPQWIKTNADWWSRGLISDGDFVKGIQYLIQQGIIVV